MSPRFFAVGSATCTGAPDTSTHDEGMNRRGGFTSHARFTDWERYRQYELSGPCCCDKLVVACKAVAYISQVRPACCLACWWRACRGPRRDGHGVLRSDSRKSRLLIQDSCWAGDDRQNRERVASSSALIGPGNEMPPAACTLRGAAGLDIEGSWRGVCLSILGPVGYPQPSRLVLGVRPGGLGPGLSPFSRICRCPMVPGSRKTRDEWHVVRPGEGGLQDAGARPGFHGLKLSMAAILARTHRRAAQHVVSLRTRLPRIRGLGRGLGGAVGNEVERRQDMHGGSRLGCRPRAKGSNVQASYSDMRRIFLPVAKRLRMRKDEARKWAGMHTGGVLQRLTNRRWPPLAAFPLPHANLGRLCRVVSGQPEPSLTWVPKEGRAGGASSDGRCMRSKVLAWAGGGRTALPFPYWGIYEGWLDSADMSWPEVPGVRHDVALLPLGKWEAPVPGLRRVALHRARVVSIHLSSE